MMARMMGNNYIDNIESVALIVSIGNHMLLSAMVASAI